jgi:ABC-type glycerol-3-phosphate transport system permease component
VSTFYGAITTCLLPVLYALLGTCAYLLRSFEQEMTTKTYVPSSANSARFLIAGIGGGVVGLFNSFTVTQGASIPPLAIAFLVGYAVDVFFSFLEGLLQAFTKTRTAAVPQPVGPAASART